jgi:hypothetical protein
MSSAGPIAFKIDSQTNPAWIHFTSDAPLNPQVFWEVMDWVGEGADWLEWNPKGVLSASLKAVYIPETKQLWMVMLPSGKGVVAQLYQKSGNTHLKFNLISLKDAIPPLKILSWNYEHTFLDFKLLSPTRCMLSSKEACVFSHKQYPAIKAEVSEKRLEMQYENHDKSPLVFPDDFNGLDPFEKKQLINDLKSFLEHEYTLMVKTFVVTTRDIFNWQPWYFKKEKPGFISEGQIISIVESGSRVGLHRILYYSDGHKSLSFYSDLQGRFRMVIE